MKNNTSTFDQYILELFENSNYQELFEILKKIKISEFKDDILKLFAIATFKLKKSTYCIKLCNFMISRGYDFDYFIYEILAESYYHNNDLNNSLIEYHKALTLRPSLILASYRVLVLKYRLEGKVDNALLKKVEKNAYSRKNITHLRCIVGLQLSKEMYSDAYRNLIYIINELKGESYGDFSSLVYILEKCIKHKVNLGIDKEKEIISYQNKLKNLTIKHKFQSIGSDNLLVTLSPGNGYILQKYQYEADRLSLVDETASYYTLSARNIAELIVELYRQRPYKSISIVGSSKGGTGVILLLNYLQRNLVNVAIKAVSFSPQIEIYPFNKNLRIPSYRSFSELVDCNICLRNEVIKAVSNISFNINENCKLTIFYGRNFRMDKTEAEKIKNISNQVEIIELNYSGHGSSIPLTIPEGKSQDELRRVYSNLPVDEDFAELGGDKIVDIVDEIFTIYSNPEMRLHKFL